MPFQDLLTVPYMVVALCMIPDILKRPLSRGSTPSYVKAACYVLIAGPNSFSAGQAIWTRQQIVMLADLLVLWSMLR